MAVSRTALLHHAVVVAGEVSLFQNLKSLGSSPSQSGLPGARTFARSHSQHADYLCFAAQGNIDGTCAGFSQRALSSPVHAAFKDTDFGGLHAKCIFNPPIR